MIWRPACGAVRGSLDAEYIMTPVLGRPLFVTSQQHDAHVRGPAHAHPANLAHHPAPVHVLYIDACIPKSLVMLSLKACSIMRDAHCTTHGRRITPLTEQQKYRCCQSVYSHCIHHKHRTIYAFRCSTSLASWQLAQLPQQQAQMMSSTTDPWMPNSSLAFPRNSTREMQGKQHVST